MTAVAPVVTRWWRRVSRPIAQASLRTRVLLLAVSLLAVGLVAFSVVVNNALRGYLVQRVDAQLTASAEVLARVPPALALDAAQTDRLGGGILQGLFGDRAVTYLTASGTVEGVISPTASAQDATGPELPPLDAAEVAAHGQRPFTVASRDGQGQWRVIALPSDEGPDSVVVSTPLDQVNGTVDQMRTISLATGLALLAVLAVVGFFAVRSGLRPLSRIEESAAAIADGDLSHRVPDLAAPGTEIGRLTAALNGMLAQIETAFATRAESEARMGRFVADASHELRTPLVGIKGFTDLYRMGALPKRADVDRTMDHIAREAQRLAGLVEDMLLLARLDERSLSTPDDHGRNGALPLDLAPMDLRTLAAAYLRALLPHGRIPQPHERRGRRTRTGHRPIPGHRTRRTHRTAVGAGSGSRLPATPATPGRPRTGHPRMTRRQTAPGSAAVYRGCRHAGQLECVGGGEENSVTFAVRCQGG